MEFNHEPVVVQVDLTASLIQGGVGACRFLYQTLLDIGINNKQAGVLSSKLTIVNSQFLPLNILVDRVLFHVLHVDITADGR